MILFAATLGKTDRFPVTIDPPGSGDVPDFAVFLYASVGPPHTKNTAEVQSMNRMSIPLTIFAAMLLSATAQADTKHRPARH